MSGKRIVRTWNTRVGRWRIPWESFISQVQVTLVLGGVTSMGSAPVKVQIWPLPLGEKLLKSSATQQRLLLSNSPRQWDNLLDWCTISLINSTFTTPNHRYFLWSWFNDIYYLDQIQFSNMVFISNCSPDIRHRYSSNGHLWIRWYIFQFSDHCGHPFIRIHSSKLRGVYIPWN